MLSGMVQGWRVSAPSCTARKGEDRGVLGEMGRRQVGGCSLVLSALWKCNNCLHSMTKK